MKINVTQGKKEVIFHLLEHFHDQHLELCLLHMVIKNLRCG